MLDFEMYRFEILNHSTMEENIFELDPAVAELILQQTLS